jgi:CubicO group peptidase (beta-lactamase class C family)
MITEIEALIEASLPEHGPGAAIAVIREGTVIHCKGYGLANLEWAIPIQPDTVFRLASITKQFTATALMLLCNQGKLSLDDPITTYLPDYPTQGYDIRIHHLLTHTSGIKSITSLEGYFERQVQHPMTPQQLCDLFKDLPFDFAPGEQFRYNNSGYVLLGLLIEQVSGSSYARFIEEHIFHPLGLQHSYYLADEAIIPRRANGYHKTDTGFQNAPFLSMTHPYAAGSLGSTIEDLIRWDQALREHTLLDPATLERMYTPVTLNDGTTESYGLGWQVAMYHGHRAVAHSGGIHGFATYSIRFPGDGAAVTVLANHDSFNASRLAHAISKHILNIPTIERVTTPLDEATLARMTGTYHKAGETVEVLLEGPELVVQTPRYTLLPLTVTTFATEEDEDVEVHFDPEPAEQAQKITIYSPFGRWSGTRA